VDEGRERRGKRRDEAKRRRGEQLRRIKAKKCERPPMKRGKGWGAAEEKGTARFSCRKGSGEPWGQVSPLRCKSRKREFLGGKKTEVSSLGD